MSKRGKKNNLPKTTSLPARARKYVHLVDGISEVLETARHASTQAVNSIITATYWEIGHRIVQFEQKGLERAEYGEAVIENLSTDLTAKFGRGFSRQNLQQMRQFYLLYPPDQIIQTPSGKSSQTTSAQIRQTASGEFSPARIAAHFPLPWSAYVRLLVVKNNHARRFYETETLRGGWSVRQLDRQINSQYYERTALSRNKAAMLVKGSKTKPDETVTFEEEVKDPYVLEFLGLKDEYSESDLEEALIRHLETFLLELGGDFCFVGRQKRLRIGDEWCRVDLLFFHRRLKCLVVIDLKLGRFTHADAGQMHMYLNYAARNWTGPGENPPVGLILCARKDEALVRYALDNLSNKMMAAEYRTVLPDEKVIAEELERTRRLLENPSRKKETHKKS